jgi:hypothetical protein
VTYIEEIARAIHSRVSPDRPLPDEERGLYLIYAVLALTVGERVTRRDVHDAWSAWKATTDPDHESIQPFEELDAGVQQEDEPFVSAIKEAARLLGATGKA